MITIRPVVGADLDTFYEHQIDPIAIANAAFGGIPDRDTFMARWAERLPNPTSVHRTVVVDGRVCGNVISWMWDDGQRYVAYWIGREFWGQGIGSEALRLFVAEIPERPLFALAVVHNIGSQRVLEKNGFVQVKREQSPEPGIEEFVYRLDQFNP